MGERVTNKEKAGIKPPGGMLSMERAMAPLGACNKAGLQMRNIMMGSSAETEILEGLLR